MPPKYKPIPARQVRAWIDSAVAVSKERVGKISQRFVDGKITLPAWQTQIQAEIKAAHTAMAEIASGGRAQFTAAQAGRLGQRLREQYKFLSGFGLQVEQGLAGSPDQIVARAQMYAEAERTTYEAMHRAGMAAAGFEEERNILGGGDNCEGCLDATAEDWVPIGTLTEVGSRNCLSNCNCEISYR